MYPGVIRQILTHPLDGLERYQEMMQLLTDSAVLKVFLNVAGE